MSVLHHQQLNLQADLLQLHEHNPQRYPFLLQSVAHGTPQARYDILFAFPASHLQLHNDGHLYRDGADLGIEDFLKTLDGLWAQEQDDEPDLELPFRGGWFVYLGYELAGQIEPVLQLRDAPGLLPVALAVRIPAAVILDHASGKLHLLSEAPELLSVMQQDLQAIKQQPALEADVALPIKNILEADADAHLQGVERVQHYIIEGDVFQVNLSRRWQAQLSQAVSPASVYRRLRRSNPAPFAGLLQWQGGAVISSSPERLVEVRDGLVQTRPIAGTRQRAVDMSQDQALAAELLDHPKERAEHVMLLDLERNDLGRICVPGTVEVNEKMVLESYAHVHHIVSNVRGRLRPEITPGEVIRAVFPGGTITGCPKVRCMEILAELEAEGRGAYTGSMGYLNHNGDMDLNILIRTLEMHGTSLSLRAGGGIVADSNPQRELEETRSKAKGLLLALGEGPL